VEFSFFVLADSGAFVTAKPDTYIPADIILRPFTWGVWLWLGISFFAVYVFSVFAVQYSKYMYNT